MQQFNDVSFACARKITQTYSTSFSLGIRCLATHLHEPIYGIYGFVRCADEIVDTFHDYDKAQLLADFRTETWRAIELGASANPILQAFQLVVHTYNLPHDLIEAFFESMEMDLDRERYNQHLYDRYIYGSAEVIGLMCLAVFCNGDMAAYRKLETPARRLGAAFQKTNFLRDMRSDYQERGRVYFPGVDFSQFDDKAKARIEADIEADFEAAAEGIFRLPRTARLGVYVAYVYYRRLFAKIRRHGAEDVRARRIRLSNAYKFRLLMTSMLRFRLGVTRQQGRLSAPPESVSA